MKAEPLACLANALWLGSCLPEHWRFSRALGHPCETQDAWLRRALARHAGCEFGQQHGFATMRNYADFAQRVPLTDYAGVAPWVERIRRGNGESGDGGVLTADRVTRLVPTSGTSGGARKLIPFTAGLQAGFDAVVSAWMVELAHAEPGIVGGPAYWAISPAIDFPAERSAVAIGFDDDRAYLGGLRRGLAGAVMAVPAAARLVADVERWRYVTLLALLRRRELRLVSVWHPSFFELLLAAAQEAWPQLCEDVCTGGCRCEPAGWARARPDAKRARELLALGPLRCAEWWPRLRVVSAWGGGAAEAGLAALRRRFPDALVQAKGLLATEAAVTLPWRGRHVLAVTAHFFEFLDLAGNVWRAHELAVGRRYEVVVSNGGGLWRYRLGDLVEVEGFVDATPALRFLGRAGNVCDLRGEKIDEPFVASVLDKLWDAKSGNAGGGERPQFAVLVACDIGDETGTAAESAAGNAATAGSTAAAGYVLVVDAADAATTGDAAALAALAARLECGLQENPHYAIARHLGQLAPARVRIADGDLKGTFLRAELAAGRRLGDIKFPVLARHGRGIFVGRSTAANLRAPTSDRHLALQ